MELAFERGTPVGDQRRRDAARRSDRQPATIAGAHGVGRLDLVENRAAGRCRKVYEAPAAVVLHAAHRELHEAGRVARSRALRAAGQRRTTPTSICHGLWFTPLREALDAFVDKVQERVTGEVRLKLFKGALSRPPAASAAARSPPRPMTDDCASSIARRLRLDDCITSGLAASTPLPTRPPSNGARRSASIAASSRTTSPAAWRGRARCRRPAC